MPPVRSASAYWRGWPEVRADLSPSIRLVLVLALTGAPAGVLWWALAPRADFRITETGPVVVGRPTEELLMADDAVFALIVAGIGLLAGTGAWFLRRRRGVATVLALALGACLLSVVAWQVGEALGPGPTEAELAEVGARVTTGLALGSLPAMALAPFTALLTYLAGVLHAPHDGLGRVEPAPAGSGWAALPDDEQAGQDTRPLVDVPPPGRPSV
jgi:LPXTG-motif cell wall-anchored protein